MNICQWAALCVTGCVALLLSGCQKAPPPAATPPAKVAKVANEEQLNSIELTPAAEKRLGIELVPALVRAVQRVRTYGGEVMLPPGASLIVSAPVAGTLSAPSEHGVPKIGEKLTLRQPVFQLMPLMASERSVLSPGERIRFAEARNSIASSRIDVAGQAQQAQVQVEAARISLERAERLLREQAGAARTVDDAKAQLSIAQKTLDATLARKELLDKIDIEDDPAKLAPLPIESPQAGIVRAIHVAAGELVAPGAPLFEVMDGAVVWIKVPVYVGELADLDTYAAASINPEAGAAENVAIIGEPVEAPPTATALSAAVDLYYKVNNDAGQLRPAQRVKAEIKLRGEEKNLVIPWSAVVHDIQGGTWVYQQTEPQHYVRRRVQVSYVLGDLAVLVDGALLDIKVAQIVSQGAMELFGAEFGFGK